MIFRILDLKVDHTILIFALKRFFLGGGDFFYMLGGWRVPVKENPNGSAVSEILQYKQTDKQTIKQTDIVLLCIIDIRFLPFYVFYSEQTCV